MDIASTIIKGAASQFGREFGRAGANGILKGKNAIYIQGVGDLQGRIKPSDNPITVAYKEVKKIKPLSTDKGNLRRLKQLWFFTGNTFEDIEYNYDNIELYDEFIELVKDKHAEIAIQMDNLVIKDATFNNVYDAGIRHLTTYAEKRNPIIEEGNRLAEERRIAAEKEQTTFTIVAVILLVVAAVISMTVYTATH